MTQDIETQTVEGLAQLYLEAKNELQLSRSDTVVQRSLYQREADAVRRQREEADAGRARIATLLDEKASLENALAALNQENSFLRQEDEGWRQRNRELKSQRDAARRMLIQRGDALRAIKRTVGNVNL